MEDARELVYKTVGRRVLRLRFLPARGGGRAPLLVMITGGGWSSCVKEDILWFTSPVMEDALEAGFAVLSPEYRLCRETDLPGIVTDCMDAARYAALHADELGVDPERFAFCGHSAGAQLALMAALAEQERFSEGSPFPHARYRAVCCAGFATPAVLFDEPGRPAPVAEDVLRAPLGERLGDGALRRLVSPVCHVKKGSPPVYLIHGDSDPLVRYDNALRMAEACREAGADCELLTVSGGGHSLETVDPSRPAAPDARTAYGTVRGFLERSLTAACRR